MSFSVDSWWNFLRTLAVINIALWLFAGAALQYRSAGTNPDAMRRLQLLLSGAYVLGCAFRSFLPVYDIPRLGLVDSWLSSVVIGRSVATLAELCFATQWALLLHESARVAGHDVVTKVSLAIVPLIALAEVCSWYAVLTTSNLGHVAENSLWGLSGALVVAGMFAVQARRRTRWSGMLIAWCFAGVVYVAYMFLVDVPMYWSRWIADQESQRVYLSIAEGLLDAAARRHVSFRWEDWKGEVAWMSLYFSVGVWLSISLIHAPVRRAGNKESEETAT